MRDEGGPESRAEEAISGACRRSPTSVRRHVPSTKPVCVRSAFERLPAPGHPDFRIDDDRGRGSTVLAQRGEREQGRGRVAARVGHEVARGRPELGQPVAPARELSRPRVREAVPVFVHDRVEEAVRAREVDDDAARRRLDRRGLLVRQAEKGHIRAAGEGRVVGDEARHPATAVAVETGVERGRVASGERIRPDGVQLELGMPEHAIEGLLAGVPEPPTMLTEAIRIVCLKTARYADVVPIRLVTHAHQARRHARARRIPRRSHPGCCSPRPRARPDRRDRRRFRGRHPLPETSDLAAAFGRAGINPETFVLAYDEGTGWAARCWWLLRHLGHAAAGTFDLRSYRGGWKPERVPCRDSPPAFCPASAPTT